MKTLCLDFGNTRLKYALFEQDQIIRAENLRDDSADTLDELLSQCQPDRTILSSVIRHNPLWEERLAAHGSFHRLCHLTRMPFTLAVGKPETMGADRLALAAAAVRFFPQRNNLVIGLGTAITYNFINPYHQFLGGGISPGMEIRFRSLHEQTALLPWVEKEWNFPLIGYDTRTNILSGVMLGIAGEIDGIIQRYTDRYADLQVVLTGGDNGYLAGLLKSRIFADSDFLFKGLYALSEINEPS
ncbi:MAG: type III pantothenate kinase [Bacteroidetes bacterium]|nr:type III pantothenate kinase [Bacteroidota bacterium]